MELNNAANILKHLEKQSALLQEARNKMASELLRLQVEEEMLMRKFYDLSDALGLNKKREVRRLTSNDLEDEESNMVAKNPKEQ